VAFFSDRRIGHPIGGQQHNPGPLRQARLTDGERVSRASSPRSPSRNGSAAAG